MMTVKVSCLNAPHVVLHFNSDGDDEVNFQWPEFAIDFIGLALHGMQQGRVEKLVINGYEVNAILMSQTCGVIAASDIFKTNHPHFPYQRLSDILLNKFRP